MGVWSIPSVTDAIGTTWPELLSLAVHNIFWTAGRPVEFHGASTLWCTLSTWKLHFGSAEFLLLFLAMRLAPMA